MTRSEIKTGTIPTRRAKKLAGPRFAVPDRICAKCANSKPTVAHQCHMTRCACVTCAERAGR